MVSDIISMINDGKLSHIEINDLLSILHRTYFDPKLTENRS